MRIMIPVMGATWSLIQETDTPCQSFHCIYKDMAAIMKGKKKKMEQA